jgi:hypothetical protein
MRRKIRRASEKALAVNPPFCPPQNTAQKSLPLPAAPPSAAHRPGEQTSPPRPAATSTPPRAEPMRTEPMRQTMAAVAGPTGQSAAPDTVARAGITSPTETEAPQPAIVEGLPTQVGPPALIPLAQEEAETATPSAPGGHARPAPPAPADEPWQIPQWQYRTKRARTNQRQQRK